MRRREQRRERKNPKGITAKKKKCHWRQWSSKERNIGELVLDFSFISPLCCCCCCCLCRDLFCFLYIHSGKRKDAIFFDCLSIITSRRSICLENEWRRAMYQNMRQCLTIIYILEPIKECRFFLSVYYSFAAAGYILF